MKTVKITPPDGYQIDQEKSSFEEIVFKPIQEKKKNVITNLNIPQGGDIEINGEWAFSILKEEDHDNGYAGKTVSGHRASLFLCKGRTTGEWYDTQRTDVDNCEANAN